MTVSIVIIGAKQAERKTVCNRVADILKKNTRLGSIVIEDVKIVSYGNVDLHVETEIGNLSIAPHLHMYILGKYATCFVIHLCYRLAWQICTKRFCADRTLLMVSSVLK